MRNSIVIIDKALRKKATRFNGIY